MFAILTITAPIFILIALGWLVCRLQIMSKEHVQGLGRFVINLALPALVIHALVDRPIHEIIEPNFLLAYGAGSVVVFWAGLLFFRFWRRADLTSSALSGMGMSISNSGFIGFPIVVMAVGQSAAVALALCMIIENMLMIPMGLALAEMGRQSGNSFLQSLKGTFRNLLRNPVIIAISTGLLLSLLSYQPPAMVMKVIDMLAQASAPLALFVIGGSLFGLKGNADMLKDMLQISLTKLIVHPLAVLLGLSLLPVADATLFKAGVLFACAPMMSIYSILGQRFGQEKRCAAILLTATVLAFFTISCLVPIIS